jgi:hypothetical protein
MAQAVFVGLLKPPTTIIQIISDELDQLINPIGTVTTKLLEHTRQATGLLSSGTVLTGTYMATAHYRPPLRQVIGGKLRVLHNSLVKLPVTLL